MDTTGLRPASDHEIGNQILFMVVTIPLLLLAFVVVTPILIGLSVLFEHTTMWLTRLRVNILTSLCMILLGFERYFFGVSCTVVIRMHGFTDLPFLLCRIVVTLVFFAIAVAFIIGTTASARLAWRGWKTRGGAVL